MYFKRFCRCMAMKDASVLAESPGSGTPTVMLCSSGTFPLGPQDPTSAR